jgi:hypothetical protein
MVWIILVDIVGLFLDLSSDLFMYLTIGIRALSLAKEGNNFCLFLQIFSREKRGRHFQVHI